MPHMIMLGMANVIKQRVSLEILHLIDAQDFVEDDYKDAERDFARMEKKDFIELRSIFFSPALLFSLVVSYHY